LAGIGQSASVKFDNFDRNGGFRAENRSLIGQLLPVTMLKLLPNT
jgi:hypothetical protein